MTDQLGSGFTFNSICNYQVQLPSDLAGEYDQLSITLHELDNALVYVSVGTSFESTEVEELLMEEGATVNILNPNMAFVSVVARDNNSLSDFRLSTSWLQRDSKRLTEEQK